MKSKYALWGAAIVGSLIGLVGLVQRFTGGHTTAAYSSSVPWGIWVAVYTSLVGISVGAAVVAALAYGLRIQGLRHLGRIALYTAIASLAGGLLAILLDLGRPERFLRLLFSPSFGSVMGLLGWLYVVYGLVLVSLVYVVIKNPDSSASRTLGFLVLPLALLVGVTEGSLFGVVKARPMWESALTPVLFLVEGMVSGVGLVLLLSVLFGRFDRDRGQVLRWLSVGLLFGAGLLTLTEYSTGLYANIPAEVEGLQFVLSGPDAWLFWVVTVGLGLVIPLLLLVFFGKNLASLATAGGLISFTAIAAKYNLIVPGLLVPQLPGLDTAFIGEGMLFAYAPTPTEWMVSLGIVALAGLIFLGIDQFFPEAVEGSRIPSTSKRKVNTSK